MVKENVKQWLSYTQYLRQFYSDLEGLAQKKFGGVKVNKVNIWKADDWQMVISICCDMHFT